MPIGHCEVMAAFGSRNGAHTQGNADLCVSTADLLREMEFIVTGGYSKPPGFQPQPGAEECFRGWSLRPRQAPVLLCCLGASTALQAPEPAERASRSSAAGAAAKDQPGQNEGRQQQRHPAAA